MIKQATYQLSQLLHSRLLLSPIGSSSCIIPRLHKEDHKTLNLAGTKRSTPELTIESPQNGTSHAIPNCNKLPPLPLTTLLHPISADIM